MRIIPTKHSLQRRSHHKVKDKQEVIKWGEYLVNKYKMLTFKDSIYKIRSKGHILVLKKEKSNFVIITMVNFNDKLWENRDNVRFKIIDTVEQMKTKVWRVNFVGRTVHCASLVFNKDNSVRLKFRKHMFSKFIIPDEYQYTSFKGLKFDSLEDIDFISKKDDRLILNVEFERK